MDKDSKIFFFKGSENILAKEDKNGKEPLERIKESFNKVLDGKNLSFLLGAGCSSFKEKDGDDWIEVGIPTMLSLAKEFFESILLEEDNIWLKTSIHIDTSKKEFNSNLEIFLGTLLSLKFFYENTNVECSGINKDIYLKISKIIKQAQEYLIRKCINEENKEFSKDQPLIDLYKHFYRKLLYRNSNLPKPNIFTTNYDLYSETALDTLGIHYVNGFSGGIRKYFNPTIFNYALAEKMDLSQTKWSVIDNFFYLYKIHGSINWIEDDEDSKLFRVKEIQETSFENLQKKGTIMIHPTPLKQNASLGSPYADLFREFQKKLMQNNNVLVAIGYSFGDEHINNLIYQAFTIPSFRLIVIGSPECNPEINKLKSLDDPRIWIIGGEIDNDEKLHYFKGFVTEILPDLSNDEIDNKIEQAIKTLLKNHD